MFSRAVTVAVLWSHPFPRVHRRQIREEGGELTWFEVGAEPAVRRPERVWAFLVPLAGAMRAVRIPGAESGGEEHSPGFEMAHHT